MTTAPAVSQSTLELQSDVATAIELDVQLVGAEVRFRAMQGQKHFWIAIAVQETDVAWLRIGVGAAPMSAVHTWAEGTRVGVEYATSLGAVRAHLELIESATLRCVTTLLPAHDLRMTPAPRDLLMRGEDGIVFTHQRGLRGGIVFTGSRLPRPFNLFYLQTSPH